MIPNLYLGNGGKSPFPSFKKWLFRVPSRNICSPITGVPRGGDGAHLVEAGGFSKLFPNKVGAGTISLSFFPETLFNGVSWFP